MGKSESNYLELLAALEARGWTMGDLTEWLNLIGHAVHGEVVMLWADKNAIANGVEVPRWPLLLMQGLLGEAAFPKLRYFTRSEFGSWVVWMHPALLHALDACRHVLDAPLRISATAGSLGRHLQNALSLHNVDRLGQVMAADLILPPGMPLDDAFEGVSSAGVVSGIGLYPDWRQGQGIHLDVRHLTPLNVTKTATVRSPATWSGVNGAGGKQVYQTLEYVLKR